MNAIETLQNYVNKLKKTGSFDQLVEVDEISNLQFSHSINGLEVVPVMHFMGGYLPSYKKNDAKKALGVDYIPIGLWNQLVNFNDYTVKKRYAVKLSNENEVRSAMGTKDPKMSRTQFKKASDGLELHQLNIDTDIS